MLEAVASYDMWILHAYLGPAGSNNDINVLNESYLFDDLLQDRALEVVYNIAGQQFTKGYYLADGIYIEWVTLVKSFKCPIEEKNLEFKRYQDAVRNDIEQAFGVLQGRWTIIKTPTQPYNINKIQQIMYTCMILHNMITEDNNRAMCLLEDDYLANPTNLVQCSWNERVSTKMRMNKELCDARVHHRLRNTPIDHIWNIPPNIRQR